MSLPNSNLEGICAMSLNEILVRNRDSEGCHMNVAVGVPDTKIGMLGESPVPSWQQEALGLPKN